MTSPCTRLDFFDRPYMPCSRVVLMTPTSSRRIFSATKPILNCELESHLCRPLLPLPLPHPHPLLLPPPLPPPLPPLLLLCFRLYLFLKEFLLTAPHFLFPLLFFPTIHIVPIFSHIQMSTPPALRRFRLWKVLAIIQKKWNGRWKLGLCLRTAERGRREKRKTLL